MEITSILDKRVSGLIFGTLDPDPLPAAIRELVRSLLRRRNRCRDRQVDTIDALILGLVDPFRSASPPPEAAATDELIRGLIDATSPLKGAPIATAPITPGVESEPMLLFPGPQWSGEPARWIIGVWSGGDWCDLHAELCLPTHWAPLPPVPNEEKE